MLLRVQYPLYIISCKSSSNYGTSHHLHHIIFLYLCSRLFYTIYWREFLVVTVLFASTSCSFQGSSDCASLSLNFDLVPSQLISNPHLVLDFTFLNSILHHHGLASICWTAATLPDQTLKLIDIMALLSVY